MSALRLVLLLCAAVLYSAAHTPETKLLRPPHAGPINDGASDVEKLLEKLEKAIKEAIEDALHTITALIDQLEKAAAAIIDETKTALEIAIKPFLDALKTLENEAAEAAVDITMCIGSSFDDITALPEKFLQKVTCCLNDKLDGAKKYVNQTIEDIECTFDVVANIGNDVKQCSKKSFLEQVVCYAEIATDISASIVSLPIKIAKDVENVKLYIAAAIPSLAVCSAGVVADCGLDAAAIVAEVTDCAMDRMNKTVVIS